ncbi:MAG: hypothetical protein JXA44_04105 [Methanospirillaceae archaeon]|nr:hypothetical protein [Methanospirillaceae archaeon]
MKDFSREELEEGRPEYGVLQCIEFCLDQLYADREHTINQAFANSRLTFEELIGTLLVARDTITDHQKENDEWVESFNQ